jgi:hypothetical protein
MAALKNYEQKNSATSGKLNKAVYVSYGYVYILCTSQYGRLQYNWLFVGLGVGGWGEMGEKFVSKAMGENGDRLGV